MALFRLAVCGTLRLGLLAVVWGFLGGAATAGPAREGSAEGRELFFREWTPGDTRSHGGDGLGPLYNETSCVACHNLGAPGGAGPASKNVEIVSLIGGSRTKDRDPGELDEYHPGFRKAPSVLLHRFGTDSEYKAWRLRRVEGIEFADMAEQGGTAEIEQIREMLGLKPDMRARALTQFRRPVAAARGATRVKGQFLFGTVATLTRRNPPPLFGAGLIDSVPIEALRAVAAKQDPEIHGRLNSMKDGRAGRFGWKAQTPSLKEFVESACAMELGLEVPTQHQAKPPLDFTKKENGLDLTQEECDALTSFVASFPAPIERAPAGRDDRPEVKSGRGSSRGSAARRATSTKLLRLGGRDLQRPAAPTTWLPTSPTRAATTGRSTRPRTIPRRARSGERRRSGASAIPALTCTTSPGGHPRGSRWPAARWARDASGQAVSSS